MEINKYSNFLYDIEGTVAPISFVHEVLFPYAAKEIKSFVLSNEIKKNTLDSILQDNKLDFSNGSYKSQLTENSNKESVVDYLLFLISVDRKNLGLKEIQGEIWEKGYKSGEIKSIIYSDTKDFFQKLTSAGKSISIYSSGSILAQKLIFEFSDQGDLTKYIQNYFDTGTGPKKESKSYELIAKSLNSSPESIIFFTDIYEEALAAKKSGVQAVILKRPGNKPLNNEEGFPELENFNDLSV